MVLQNKLIDSYNDEDLFSENNGVDFFRENKDPDFSVSDNKKSEFKEGISKYR